MNVELFKEGLTSILKITKEAPVLLEVKNGRLIIASHNNFHSVIFEMQTDLEDFKVVLPEKLARQLPRQIKNTIDLTIDDEENKLTIKSEGVKLNTATLGKDSMSLSSLVKHYTKEETWTLNGAQFKEAINKAMHSANDKSIGDIVLKGYHLSFKQDEAELMASNGAAMTVITFPVSSYEEDEKLFLLNQDFFSAANLLHDGEVTLAYNTHAVTLFSKTDDSSIRIVSSLTQGQPLNYQKVMDMVYEPERNKESVFGYVNTKELKEAMKKMTFFFDDTSKYRIKLDIDSDRIIFNSGNMYGETKNQIRFMDTTVEDPITLYLSGANLNSYLSSVKSETIKLTVKDDKTPVLFSDDLGIEILTVFNV